MNINRNVRKTAQYLQACVILRKIDGAQAETTPCLVFTH